MSYNSIDVTPETTEEKQMMFAAKANAQQLSQRFILSDKRTSGLDYDDRLTVRLAMSRNSILKYIAAGKLQPYPIDGKIIVSERSVRRFEDGLVPMAIVGSSEDKAA
ncbi:helix-turn-helix domain-containing protein [Hymenobacter fodinae]|uniref:helix-turn-helix domain-containing protein n=1 Tax=Hymenobacter fodinae TaxID=2510796 RepID=UPI00143685D5|nr:helix-turn-helix domain-containing protein [Hymenobacter fodinae]